MNEQWDVFIAHATADRVVARELYARLERECRTYLAEVTTELGRPWPAGISDAQRVARCTVVLVSAATNSAHYQQEEIAAALARARQPGVDHLVVPVYLDADVAADP